MKKVNGILILIMALSIAVLAFVMYSTGMFKSGEEEPAANPTAVPTVSEGATPTPIQFKEFEVDPIEHFMEPADNSDIYTYRFQTAVRNSINQLIAENDYICEAPLVIFNPFCTNTLGLYIYFETEEDYAVTYRVHTPAMYSNVSDFSGNVYYMTEKKEYVDGEVLDIGNSRVHEFVINGLIPNETNHITLILTNEYGETLMRNFYVNVGDIVSPKEMTLKPKKATKTVIDEVTLEEKTVDSSTEELSDGLFAVFSKENSLNPYVRVYDNKGFIKMEIPLEAYNEDELLFRDHELFMRVNDQKIVSLNALGEVTGIFITDDYKFTGDWCFDEKGNLLMIASEDGKHNDKVVCLDINKAQFTELFDVNDIYKNAGEISDEKYKELIYNLGQGIDITSIEYAGDNMLLLTVNHDTVLKVRRIYNSPRLLYAITNNKYLKEAIPDYVYRKEGDYKLPSSMEKVELEAYDLIRDSRHYILVYDGNTNYKYEKKEEHFGILQKLLIDEDEKTVRFVEAVNLPDITADSCIETFDKHRVYLSSKDSMFYEYDSEMNLIYSFKYIEPIVDKTIEQIEHEEDFPPADISITYNGVMKFNPSDWCTSDSLVIYKTE